MLALSTLQIGKLWQQTGSNGRGSATVDLTVFMSISHVPEKLKVNVELCKLFVYYLASAVTLLCR